MNVDVDRGIGSEVKESPAGCLDTAGIVLIRASMSALPRRSVLEHSLSAWLQKV